MKKKQKKISTEVVRRKRNFKIGLFSGVVLLGTAVASIAATCVNDNSSNEIFRSASSGNILQENNSPLNPTFTNSPISNYASSSMISLLNYETSGKFQFDEAGNATETPVDSLKLEAATKVVLLGKDGNPLIDINDNPVEFNRDAGPIDDNVTVQLKGETDKINPQGLAYGYRFYIDQNIKWVDKDGKPQQSLSGKDFERGLETYALSAALNYNANGYFMDLIGLNFGKTVSYASQKDGEYVPVDSVDYDINNYKNSDETFTLYLEKPYPYLFSILTKDTFNPVPHTNPYVQNIRVTDSNQPISVTTDKEGKKFIDSQNTDWNQLYGSGEVGTFLDHSWFAGAYYFNIFSKNQFVLKLNKIYMDAVGPSLNPNNGKKKIETYLVDYGSGNSEVFYERFIAKQISSAPIPESRRTEAIGRFLNNGLVVSSVTKISQSNYIVYTPLPYVFDNNNNVYVNNSGGATTISDQAAQMIYNWNSEPSIIIRTGLSGLINHYQLSKLNIPEGDFQYSSIPFGALNLSTGLISSQLNDVGDYYRAIDKDILYGGLPRHASDYVEASTKDFGIDYTFTSGKDDFTIPYYYFDKGTIVHKNLEINRKSFIDALKAYGATPARPFVLQYKYGEATLSDNYDNYLKALQRAIEALGTDSTGSYLKFNLVNRNATNPTINGWYRLKQSSMGFSYWGPDYNAVGTWIEANSTLDANGLPATNNHNFFGTLIRTLISNAKDLNVTFDENAYNKDNPDKDKEFATIPDPNTTKSIFSSDPRISPAFPNADYSKLGIDFLNFLVKNKVLNKKAVIDLAKDTTGILETLNKKRPEPKTKGQLFPLLAGGALPGGESIFNVDEKNNKIWTSKDFSKYLGEWSGLNPNNALWLTISMDNDYSLMPRSEVGIRAKGYSLVDPKFFLRSSSVGPTNIRDSQVN